MIQKMQDDIVRKFGFEHPVTITFFRVCETGNYEKIHFIYGQIIENIGRLL